MPRKIQEQTAEQAKYDLHSLYRLLRRQEQEDENMLSAKPTQRKRKQCSRHINGPVLLSSLLFLAGLTLLIIAAFWLPNSRSCFLHLQITEDTVLFSSAVELFSYDHAIPYSSFVARNLYHNTSSLVFCWTESDHVFLCRRCLLPPSVAGRKPRPAALWKSDRDDPLGCQAAS